MNQEDLAGASHGSLNEQMEYLKAQFPILEKADLNYDKTLNKKEILVKVGEITGKSRDEFSRILATL
jgi:hypothetical protein